MNLPILGRLIDERFLTHRLRSTSVAGIAGGVLAIGLWSWHYYVDHIWNWELFSIALTIVGVKLALMTWYFLTD